MDKPIFPVALDATVKNRNFRLIVQDIDLQAPFEPVAMLYELNSDKMRIPFKPISVPG